MNEDVSEVQVFAGSELIRNLIFLRKLKNGFKNFVSRFSFQEKYLQFDMSVMKISLLFQKVEKNRVVVVFYFWYFRDNSRKG